MMGVASGTLAAPLSQASSPPQSVLPARVRCGCRRENMWVNPTAIVSARTRRLSTYVRGFCGLNARERFERLAHRPHHAAMFSQ